LFVYLFIFSFSETISYATPTITTTTQTLLPQQQQQQPVMMPFVDSNGFIYYPVTPQSYRYGFFLLFPVFFASLLCFSPNVLLPSHLVFSCSYEQMNPNVFYPNNLNLTSSFNILPSTSSSTSSLVSSSSTVFSPQRLGLQSLVIETKNASPSSSSSETEGDMSSTSTSSSLSSTSLRSTVTKTVTPTTSQPLMQPVFMQDRGLFLRYSPVLPSFILSLDVFSGMVVVQQNDLSRMLLFLNRFFSHSASSLLSSCLPS
jgi:hypothetical protein